MGSRLWASCTVRRHLPSDVGKIQTASLLPDISVHTRSKPYRPQGAAMAVEDAAALGNLLSRISHISQLGPLLKAYQDLRLPRTLIAQESSCALKGVFCLSDGPEQRERDERLRSTT